MKDGKLLIAEANGYIEKIDLQKCIKVAKLKIYENVNAGINDMIIINSEK